MEASFQFIPIDKFKESALNTRKTYNEKKLQELIESIKEKGVLAPLIARPNNGFYEIAAGSRRYRAAKAAGLKDLPVLIREMTDVEFIEVLTIENLQREDIHPLEEAEGYRSLMERGGYDVPAIAARVGKSESYIYQRLKLSDLIPEAKKLFLDEKITAGHAILIARLQPDQQKELVKKESGLYEGWRDRTVVSVRDLAAWIDHNVHFDLNSASFSKKDTDLLPEAGPCMTCPKRTGFLPELFPDIKKKDTCTDRECFGKKIQAFIDRWIEERSRDTDVPPLKLSGDSDYRRKKLGDDLSKPIPSNFYCEITNKKKESCQYMREGIITEGHQKGKILTVCIEGSCKTHYNRSGSSTSPETLKWKADRKRANEKKKLGETIRLRILDETLKQVPENLEKEDLIFIVGQYFEDLWQEYGKKILSRHDLKPVKEQYSLNTRKPMMEFIKTLPEPGLYKLMMEMALIRNLHKPWQGHGDPLLDIAHRYKVDPKKIEQAITQERKEKEKAKTDREKKKAKKDNKKNNSSSVKENSYSEKDLPCLDCLNDATNGKGSCFREDFYNDGKGTLVCDSKKPLQTSAKKEKKIA